MLTETIRAALVGVLAFAATNVDDLVVLTAYLAAGRVTRRDAMAGQALGTAAVMLASWVAAAGALLIPGGWHHWLGLLPLGIGLKLVVESLLLRCTGAPGRDAADSRPAQPSGDDTASRSGSVTIALLVMANSGDNLGVYIGLFATQSSLTTALQVAVALGMAVTWVWLAAKLVRHPALGAPLRWAAPFLLPWVLIGLGLLILIP